MLITLKEAARWAEENLNIEVTPATLRSACVDRRLKARRENCAGGRRGQPSEWKVSQLDLAVFLTSKYRSRKSRAAKELIPPVQLVQTIIPALPPPVKINQVVVEAIEPGAFPRPRYKVLELVLQPTLVDFERHEVYDMRVIKKNIPKHATAEKLATELASRAIRQRLSHQLHYVVEEYQSQPRRK